MKNFFKADNFLGKTHKEKGGFVTTFGGGVVWV